MSDSEMPDPSRQGRFSNANARIRHTCARLGVSRLQYEVLALMWRDQYLTRKWLTLLINKKLADWTEALVEPADTNLFEWMIENHWIELVPPRVPGCNDPHIHMTETARSLYERIEEETFGIFAWTGTMGHFAGRHSVRVVAHSEVSAVHCVKITMSITPIQLPGTARRIGPWTAGYKHFDSGIKMRFLHDPTVKVQSDRWYDMLRWLDARERQATSPELRHNLLEGIAIYTS